MGLRPKTAGTVSGNDREESRPDRRNLRLKPETARSTAGHPVAIGMLLPKVTTPDFGWISKKTMFGILRLLPCAATAEKYRISDFRETPKDQPRVLAGASIGTFDDKIFGKNRNRTCFFMIRCYIENRMIQR
jgi:hypothetical protein